MNYYFCLLLIQVFFSSSVLGDATVIQAPTITQSDGSQYKRVLADTAELAVSCLSVPGQLKDVELFSNILVAAF